MAFTFDTPRRPYRLDWGRVAAAAVNLALWAVVAGLVWAVLKVVF
jgi:hypothetical protein